MYSQFGLFVDGQWTPGTSTGEVISPVTERALGQVPMATANDTQAALDAAARAAVALVEDGMRLGLGTGSTAVFMVHRLAERIRAAGDDPTEYLEIAYRVPERRFNAWSEAMRDGFASARSETTGKPVFRLETRDR